MIRQSTEFYRGLNLFFIRSVFVLNTHEPVRCNKKTANLWFKKSATIAFAYVASQWRSLISSRPVLNKIYAQIHSHTYPYVCHYRVHAVAHLIYVKWIYTKRSRLFQSFVHCVCANVSYFLHKSRAAKISKKINKFSLFSGLFWSSEEILSQKKWVDEVKKKRHCIFCVHFKVTA